MEGRNVKTMLTMWKKSIHRDTPFAGNVNRGKKKGRGGTQNLGE